MPLQDILTSLAKDFGLDLSNSAEVASLTDDVNRTVRDLHNSRKYPLRYSVRERLVNLGTNSQVIALPESVGKILAVREPETFEDVRIKGFEDRYFRQSWYPPFLEFRQKERVAVKVNLLTYGPLTLTFKAAVSAPVSVVVTGSTEHSARLSETVVFNVGETTKLTANNYKDIEAITKSAATETDLVVTDLNDVELSVIPNNKKSTTYQLLQVLEPNMLLSRDRIVEILYKLAWQPFVNLGDTYYGINDYDNGFYYATKALIAQRMGDMSLQDYATAKREAIDILNSVDSEAESGEPEMYDVPNAFLGMQPTSDGLVNSRFGNYWR